tara:strand:+ start:1646 stop:1996 length:351 start_codon:yes stop_codon:yes gene_type:complete
MDYRKFISFIKNDFENSNSKYPSIKFFRSNIILIFIWFWTLEKMYEKKNLNVEQLIEDIPKGFGSRPTIFKFLNLAIKKKFLLKISDLNDKRKYKLKLSEDSISDFENWAKGFRGF